MRWKVVSEQPLYGDEWLDIRVADVELPDGRRLDHRLIRTPPGAGVAAVDDAGRVLLIWRHRFITDSWGWEIPLGKVEEGESPIQAAAREFEEETGWRAGPLRHLIDVQPTPGISDSRHHVYVARTATQVGEPDGIESERTEWIPLSGLASLIEKGDMASGTTLAALLYLQSKIKLSGVTPGQPNRLACAATHCWKVPAGRPVIWATVGSTVASSRVPPE